MPGSWPYPYGYTADQYIQAAVPWLTNDQPYSTTTKPTLDQINDWITRASARIDSRLVTLGVDVPVTGATTDITLIGLRDLATELAAAQAAVARQQNVILEPGQRTSAQSRLLVAEQNLNNDEYLLGIVGQLPNVADQLTSGLFLPDPDTGQEKEPLFTARRVY